MNLLLMSRKTKVSLCNITSKISPESEYIAPGVWYKGRCATFQATMKLTILFGQCFGLIPVLGVCEIDTSKLRFSFFSGRCLYSVMSILGQCTIVCFCVMNLLKDTDSSLSSNTSVIFYSINCFTTMLFFRIATKWPRFCQQVSLTEASDPNMDTSLIRKCNISCIVILALALVEHVLSHLNSVAAVMDCEPEGDLYMRFIVYSFPWVYTFVPYNHVIGVISQFLNFQCTFNWNFADIFVICVSFYLISRLNQVNKRIASVKGRNVPSSFWRTMREDYSRVTSLVRKVDDVIGAIIFISFANNLFFICLQLLHTLAKGFRQTPSCRAEGSDIRPFHGYEQAVYFVYSVMFLVARALAVSLIASRVNIASREPAYALYNVPSAEYCVEVQRFLDQIHGETVALSGLQFFNVKRGLVLTIAGTIVTYELVLMQFTGVTPTASPPTN